MKRYSEFRPTGFDTKGLGCEDRQNWFVHPCGTNRDADALTRSNFEVSCAELEKVDPEGVDHEVHSFGHWACGWFEIILVRPDSACAKEAADTEAGLADYPVCNDEHFSETEMKEANEVWANCYSIEARIDYIREGRSQFEFRGFADLLGCVRGKYFGGNACDLLT